MPYLLQAAFWVGVVGTVVAGWIPLGGGWFAGWLVSKLPDTPVEEAA